MHKKYVVIWITAPCRSYKQPNLVFISAFYSFNKKYDTQNAEIKRF